MKKFFLRYLLFLFLALLGTLILTIAGIFAIRTIAKEFKPKYLPIPFGGKAKFFATRSTNGTYMYLQNLKFRLEDDISIRVKKLFAKAVPTNPTGIVNFDDINSFKIQIYQGEVYVGADVLEKLFNRYVFNYPGSQLKNLKIQFQEGKLYLEGDMKLVLWIGFKMVAQLKLDKKRNLMKIIPEKITTLGNPFTKELMGLVGLSLDKLLFIPEGRGIRIQENIMLVEPFRIFPPPKIEGNIASVRILKKSMRLIFEGEIPVEMPPLTLKETPKNYLRLYQGDVKFGKLIMVSASLIMLDKDLKDPFDFYLKKYKIPLVFGYSQILKDGSVVVYMPDFGEVYRR